MFKDDPLYRAMYVRTQYDQLLGSGGLWEIASKYYPLFGAVGFKSMPPYYKFPSGAICQFKQIADEVVAEKHRGLRLSPPKKRFLDNKHLELLES